MESEQFDTQDRYDVFAELDQLYQQAHARYMQAILSGDPERIQACELECQRIQDEQTQAIALLRQHEVKRAYRQANGSR